MKSVLSFIVAALGLLLLPACSSEFNDDLDAYIAEVQSRPSSVIDPIPDIRIADVYRYSAAEQTLRTPFDMEEARPGAYYGGGIRPDDARPREELEQFALDTLRMVGSLECQKGTVYALIKNRAGIVYRVHEGNYIGLNHGRITAVTPQRLDLIEIIGDPVTGYFEREASISLSEK
jgi:type IV pilus assembly protein PilP